MKTADKMFEDLGYVRINSKDAIATRFADEDGKQIWVFPERVFAVFHGGKVGLEREECRAALKFMDEANGVYE